MLQIAFPQAHSKRFRRYYASVVGLAVRIVEIIAIHIHCTRFR